MIALPWEPTLPLYTERLILRVHEHGDLEDLLEFHSDPNVVRYLPWPIRTRAQVAEALIPKMRAGRVDKEDEWLVLALQLRSSKRVIGEVVLKCSSVERSEAELGYAMHAGYHGQGLAFEAASAMVGLAVGELGVERLVAELDARNAASIRLLERLGFSLHRSYESEFKGELAPGLEFELLRRPSTPGDRQTTD
jgi:RimJ/RimL family protein N-acetyltransferase